MESLFDDVELDIDCPNCDKEILFKFNDVGKSITCPHCSESIFLKDDGSFSKGKESVNKSLNDLEKALKNFGR